MQSRFAYQVPSSLKRSLSSCLHDPAFQRWDKRWDDFDVLKSVIVYGSTQLHFLVKDYSTICTQPETRKLQQVCYHQADIRMRSHRLLRLDDNKSVTSC